MLISSYQCIVLMLLHCSKTISLTSSSNWPNIFNSDCLVHIVGEHSFDSYNGYESTVPVFYESSIVSGIPEMFITKLGFAHLYQTKFTLCKVKILTLEHVLAELDTSNVRKKISTSSKISAMAKFNTNPDYVVYISNTSTENWSSSAWIFCSAFATFSSTAKFLVVFPNQDSVSISIVALHRREWTNMLETVVIHDQSDKARSEIDQQWRFVHRNLEGRAILILTEDWEVLSFQDLLQSGGCGINQRFEISERYCAITTFSQYLNISPYATATNSRFYGHILLNVIYSGKNEDFNEALTSTAYPKYDWLVTAELQESFRFAVIIDMESLGYSAIWKPFDIEIWVVVLICFFCTAAALTVMTDESCSQSISKFCNNLFDLCRVLLEQGVEFFNQLNSKRNTSKKPKIIIMVIWLWTAFLLGNAYKGTLFSFLTNHIPPVIPATIQELTSSPYRIFTTSFSSDIVGNETKYTSVLTDGILRDLMTGVPGTDFPNHYLDLNRSVIFVCAPIPRLVAAVPSESQVQSSKGLITIPKSFAIINSETDLNQLVSLIRRTLPTKIIFTGGHIDTKFSTRLPWIVMRNFFKSILSPLLAALYESGIYDKWSACIQNAYNTHYYLEWMNLSSATSGQSHASNKHQQQSKIRNEADGPKPLNFVALKNIFSLSLVCILTSALVLTGEILHNLSILN